MSGLLLFLVSMLSVSTEFCHGIASKKEGKRKRTVITQAVIEKHRQLLDEAYTSINGFRKISDEEQSMIEQAGGAHTYGEIKYNSLQTLLNELQLTSNDVFYDLGCGVGKTCMQVYLNTAVKKTVGIELCKSRYNGAMKAYAWLQEKGYISRRRELKIVFDDLLKVNMNNATIVYTCSTCFSDELMLAITKKLSKLKRGLIVLTLKKLPDHDQYNFVFVKEFILPMTWSEVSPVYMYKLK